MWDLCNCRIVIQCGATNNVNNRTVKKWKYSFPCDLQETECLNKARNHYLPQRRCVEDRQVVRYNPETLLLWGAYMNVQKEITTTGLEMYLTKYVPKTETLFSVCVDKDASNTEQYMRTRIVGCLKVENINIGHYLSQSSCLVIFMPTELNPDYGFIKQKNHLPDDIDSENAFYSTLLDKYINQPTMI